MANREDLLIIRAARAGEAAAQLKLGKRYLFGGAGLPKSLPTALYWLDRAAQQEETDAWMLIGQHVPFEIAQSATRRGALLMWYERAFDAGVAQAGLVLAKLVLGQSEGPVSETLRNKALRALQAAAHAGIAEAQWMLAQPGRHGQSDSACTWPVAGQDGADNEAMLEWAARAARSGVADARYAMADHAWAKGDLPSFLQWAGPIVDDLVGAAPPPDGVAEREVELALRTAHAMATNGPSDHATVARVLEWAALTGDAQAQYMLGLWLARMDPEGSRLHAVSGPANYKRATRWLSLAAGQGCSEAWYALSKIYQKPECSQRDTEEARHCLELAAAAGHGMALYELGVAAWRARNEGLANDVTAVECLLKAQVRGVSEAAPMLGRIAARATPASWAHAILQRISRSVAERAPLLVARIELAACFGLSRSEALLIDPKSADRGHCLVVDVRAEHPHSKRRLILVQTAEERATLDRVIAKFERAPAGEEGNFRQRLYRLKALA